LNKFGLGKKILRKIMAVNVVVRGKWRPVELEPSLFLQKDMNHLICIEELTDYNIVDKDNVGVCC